jgi:hypothetical protein
LAVRVLGEKVRELASPTSTWRIAARGVVAREEKRRKETEDGDLILVVGVVG